MKGEKGSSYRTIVEGKQYSKELAALINDPKRADEFVEGIQYVLAREPNSIEATCLDQNYPLWFIPCSCNDIVIFYTYDDNEITLLSIIDSRKL
ncbi:MAG: hypothetical protein NTW95_09810 [Candidatus Aminicenantes bacterium]|nr:hypothetical protein [Candidatus Aminicenantes bacterium]